MTNRRITEWFTKNCRGLTIIMQIFTVGCENSAWIYCLQPLQIWNKWQNTATVKMPLIHAKRVNGIRPYC